jgi:hypothetical protein
MKILAALVLQLVLISSLQAGPRQARQQQRLNRQQEQQVNRPNQRRAIVQDAVLYFYIQQFQDSGEVSHEVFAKMRPFLEQFVQSRFEISQRRSRALNVLRQTIERNGSEEELKRLVREFDSADADFQANQEKFFSNVDPMLNARQQARLRVLQIEADTRIRTYLNALQNPNPQRQGQGQGQATTP